MQTDKSYYLDHAAATPVDERVVAAMLPFMTDKFYNPSSPYDAAVSVRREYEDAKAKLAGTFGAKGDDLVITAGATESINLALASLDGHIVTSRIEHDAVLAAVLDRDVTMISPTKHGIITSESVVNAIKPETSIVSIQLANNEIGTVQPVRDIAEVVKKERDRRLSSGSKTPIWFHCDASQGFGQIDVNVARLGVDMLTLNAGKMYGPKQVGLLWTKPGVLLRPLLRGGGQERGLRSGTENVAGVIGFSLAAEIANSKRHGESKRLATLRDSLEKFILAHIENAVISGHPKKRLPGSLHFSVPGIDGERMVFALERKGVYLATGSACAANKGVRSHVLAALGMDEATADGSLRITLGRLSDEQSVFEVGKLIVDEIQHEQSRLALHA